jgi:hypothetical protein
MWINKMWRHQSNRSSTAQRTSYFPISFVSLCSWLSYIKNVATTTSYRYRIYSLYNVIKYTYRLLYKIEETFPHAHHHSSIGRYTIFIKRFITSFDLSILFEVCSKSLGNTAPNTLYIKYKNIYDFRSISPCLKHTALYIQESKDRLADILYSSYYSVYMKPMAVKGTVSKFSAC